MRKPVQYPFNSGETYLRDCWYVVATTDEVKDHPIERTVMDEPIAVFRIADGTPAAMHGVCPHRYYPLAQGRVVGNALQCNYHGFQFDGATGSCIVTPGQPAPKSYKQRIYPIAEHGPWLWIWTGAPERADRALLPPMAAMGIGEGWAVQVGPVLHGNGRAQLLVENLLDLTHIEYLHATTLRAEGVLNFPIRVREEHDAVVASRVAKTPWVDGFYDLIYGPEHHFSGEHEALGETYYHSPAYLRTSLVVSQIDGVNIVDRNVFGSFHFQHLLTPETAHSVHYFSGMSRNYRRHDQQLSDAMMKVDCAVRQQDIDAIAEIERNLSSGATLPKELLIKSDSAAIQVRRRIQETLTRNGDLDV